VLGKMVTKEAGRIRRLDKLQPLFEEFIYRPASPINPIEQSEIDVRHCDLPVFAKI
jgi:hypothetical protein